MLGDVIWAGRMSIKDRRTDKPPNQADFYALCRAAENPRLGGRAGVLFGKTTAGSRRWMGQVENGTQAIAPGHARIFEQVCQWPEGILDVPLPNYEAFWVVLGGWGATEPQNAPSPRTLPRAERAVGGGLPVVHLGGIDTQAPRKAPVASRAKLAQDIDTALRPDKVETLRVAVVQGEQGVGKSQLIAEWWNGRGKSRFNQTTFTLDCARLGGDQIVTALNDFFLSKPTAELTHDLAARLNELPRLLIVLDGLSHEDGDPLLRREGPLALDFDDDGGRLPVTYADQARQAALVPAGRADQAAFSRVREIVLFLAEAGVRASILLGVQAAEITLDALDLSRRLHASAHVEIIAVRRLLPDEGAQLLRALGVPKLSKADLRAMSERLQGLPISLAAAAHFLRVADETRAEAFLADIADGGRFKFFGEFFGHYLDALNAGDFDPQAHPHAYLRLLALMPGSVPKSRIDTLLQAGKIGRLQKGDTATFQRMRIAFIVDQGPYIDVNPMVRGLLRQDLSRRMRKAEPGVARDRAELRWIHITAAIWCHKRLPTSPTDYTIADIEMIEGALYHLLAVRDVLDEPAPGAMDDDLEQLRALLGEPPSPTAITRYCLDNIVRRFLMDRRTHRATRILGQFETKARLLGLFFDSIDEVGVPRHLDPWDQIDLYGEIGVCWMHAGRLQLAHQALGKAMLCFQALGLQMTQDSFPVLDRDRLRLWSETLSTHVLVMMRMGRPRFQIEGVLTPAAALGTRYAKAILSLGGPLDEDQKATLRSARRLICRDAYVKLRAGDLASARAGYDLAIAIEKPGGDKLSGDALRRHIEVMVRQGPCLEADLAAADSLVERQLRPRRDPGAQRRGSNDIIALYSTKIMILRARSDFAQAGELLEEALRHPFILRGECSYSARVELELERYRLIVAQNAHTPETVRDLDRLIGELEARHHLQLYGDALVILAEMEGEPRRSQLLLAADRRMNGDDWNLRRRDIETIRDGRSAIMSWGC